MSTLAKPLIGIGGLPRSGKDSLAELFIASGFYGVSLGDIVRSESSKRHSEAIDPISVANMTETSNWLRTQHGPDFALRAAQEQFDKAQANDPSLKGLIVFSVRAPAEVDYIRSHHSDLIWVEASDEVRYKRAMEHLRQGEVAISFEEFQAQESLQWQPQPGIPAEVQMNIKYVKQKATVTFYNEATFEEFQVKAKQLISDLTSK